MAKDLGLVDRLPRLVCAQVGGAMGDVGSRGRRVLARCGTWAAEVECDVLLCSLRRSSSMFTFCCSRAAYIGRRAGRAGSLSRSQGEQTEQAGTAGGLSMSQSGPSRAGSLSRSQGGQAEQASYLCRRAGVWRRPNIRHTCPSPLPLPPFLSRLCADQAQNANPLYQAYKNGFETFKAVKAKNTFASAIQVCVVASGSDCFCLSLYGGMG